MRFISSSQALGFLGEAAPKAWVRRMLLWMIQEGELNVYFSKGRIQASTCPLEFLSDSEITATGPEADDYFRKNYDPEFAQQLIGKDLIRDRVLDDPVEWDDTEQPHAVSIGFMLHADEIDWESGTLIACEIPDKVTRDDYLFWDNEHHFTTEFTRPDFHAEFSGMCFEAERIEMLLPTGQFDAPIVSRSAARPDARRPGRPQKWDWEGAMTYLAALANHPDGLPTGPGAQARIEEMLADWFQSQTGDQPATSQLRQRARKLVESLSRVEKE